MSPGAFGRMMIPALGWWMVREKLYEDGRLVQLWAHPDYTTRRITFEIADTLEEETHAETKEA